MSAAAARDTQGQHVVEVNRSDRVERRRISGSNPIDAYAAAHPALSGGASALPRTTPSPA
jgi:hypothetical protein